MQNFEETKKLLHNSTTYYLIAVGMDSNYSYVNERYQRMFEDIYGDLVGKHYSITIHPEDQQICYSVSEKAFNKPDEIFPATIRKHDGKGGYIITQWEYKAIFNNQQEPAGVFCIGHDITEHIQNTTELIDTRASLTQTQLTLQQIGYIQSHFVRKPIANIMGLSTLLKSMEMDPEVATLFNMINESAEELDKLIKDMAASNS
jgi:PAS domain S-box-containing protein